MLKLILLVATMSVTMLFLMKELEAMLNFVNENSKLKHMEQSNKYAQLFQLIRLVDTKAYSKIIIWATVITATSLTTKHIHPKFC